MEDVLVIAALVNLAGCPGFKVSPRTFTGHLSPLRLLGHSLANLASTFRSSLNVIWKIRDSPYRRVAYRVERPLVGAPLNGRGT